MNLMLADKGVLEPCHHVHLHSLHLGFNLSYGKWAWKTQKGKYSEIEESVLISGVGRCMFLNLCVCVHTCVCVCVCLWRGGWSVGKTTKIDKQGYNKQGGVGIKGEHAIFCLRGSTHLQFISSQLLILNSLAVEEERTTELIQCLDNVTNSNKFGSETTTVWLF